MPMGTKAIGKSLIIIPARMQSSRIPGKPLIMLGDRPLIWHTYQAAKKTIADMVVVAVSAGELDLVHYLSTNRIPFTHTSASMPNGTSRCLDTGLLGNAKYKCIINWQCDEPLVRAEWVDAMIRNLQTDPMYSILTIAGRRGPANATRAILGDRMAYLDPEDCRGAYPHYIARWFTRYSLLEYHYHCGIYGFSRDDILKVGRMPASRYAKAESLEQLTWLEAGHRIRVMVVDEIPQAVNEPDDIGIVSAVIAQERTTGEQE